MDSVDVETVRRYLMEHTDLADRFPNWSSSVNLSQFVHSILDEDTSFFQEPPSEEELAELEHLEAVSRQLKRHYLWVILTLGLPGNLASLLTFLHMRSLGSCVVYVAVLAVVDSVALLQKLALSLMQEFRVSFTPHSCKALLFLANALVIYANWIVVALAAERLFAVYRPLALGVYWTRSRAAWAMAGLLGICLVVCVPVIIIAVPRDEDHLTCVFAQEFRETAEAWHWANVGLYGFLPCSLLLGMNVAIISLLRRAQRQQQELCASRPGSSSHKAGSRGKRAKAGSQKQASLILLVASFVLIVLTIPRCTMLLLQQMWRPHDVVLIAKVRVFKQVTYALSDLNHAINFLLYFVSARHFRRRFLDLFRSSRWKGLRRLSTRDTVQHRILDSAYESGGNVATMQHSTSGCRLVVLTMSQKEGKNVGQQQQQQQKEEEGCWQEMRKDTSF